ncbi:hypothetical protein ACFOYW_03835 [Gryllotalpicola reticulitermitis]|uniref:DUF7882 domain-containing protein n=1 Tax=Gryllotalpicola reticulitermitis TaxID=1184153 RepID=A0ABV8Q3Y5_9MICO
MTYAGNRYEFEDRLLAHLKVAIAAKLRLREGFLLNWQIPAGEGAGRVSLWLSPDVPISFQFGGSRSPELSRIWLDALSRSSHGIRGMVALGEQEAADYLQKAGGSSAP